MEEKKKAFRFNVIDVIIILLVLAAVAALVYFLFFKNDAPSSDRVYEVEFVIESKEIRNEFSGLIKQGDTIYDMNTQRKLGEVINAEYVDSVRKTFDSGSGESKVSRVPDMLDLYITVRADDVRLTDCYVTEGRFKLIVGNEAEYRTPSFSGRGTLVSVKIITK